MFRRSVVRNWLVWLGSSSSLPIESGWDPYLDTSTFSTKNMNYAWVYRYRIEIGIRIQNLDT